MRGSILGGGSLIGVSGRCVLVLSLVLGVERGRQTGGGVMVEGRERNGEGRG